MAVCTTRLKRFAANLRKGRWNGNKRSSASGLAIPGAAAATVVESLGSLRLYFAVLYHFLGFWPAAYSFFAGGQSLRLARHGA